MDSYRKVTVTYSELCAASLPVEAYLWGKGIDLRKPFTYYKDNKTRSVFYLQHPVYSSFKWRQFGNMGWIPKWKREQEEANFYLQRYRKLIETEKQKKKKILFQKFN